MRHEHYRMNDDDTVALLARAPTMNVAAVRPDGQPILRTLHGVVVDGLLAFHASPKGEKADMDGWPAVASAVELIAQIPSHFIDPERACPATTYYESAQVQGHFRRVEAPATKARVLAALMDKLQPEGGFRPIDAEDPLYRAPVRGLLVFALSLEQISGKRKCGQNRRPEDLARVIEGLWRRGEPGDLRAIERVLAANPTVPRPAFLSGPEGTQLYLAPGAAERAEAIELLRPMYWNVNADDARIGAAQTGASAWVVAKCGARVVGTARAVSDGARHAWVYDVAVDEGWRGRGLGTALMRLLLDHPAVRGAAMVHLGTKDAMGFYARLGFEPRASVGQSVGATHMARVLRTA